MAQLFEEIPAGEFKARCLQIMDTVENTGKSVVVTKRGRPVAMMVPMVDAPRADSFGCLSGTVTILGDIVAPLDDKWDADG